MNPLALVLAIAVAAALAGIVLVAASILSGLRNRARLDPVLAGYARTIGAGEAVSLSVHSPQVKAGSANLRNRAFAHYTERLAAAGLQIPAGSYLGLGGAAVTSFSLATALLAQSWQLGMLLLAAGGWCLMHGYLAARVRARAIRFAEQLPQLIGLVSSGLESGLSFQSALTATASQDQGEVGNQLRRALSEVQFGSTLEEALQRVAKRMKSQDLEWLVMALQLHREVGGSLTGILKSATDTIRTRAELANEVRVISAEGRLSGYLLIALPAVVFAALFALRPDYVRYFFTGVEGAVMLAAAIVLIAVGWLWLNRVVKVSV